MTVGLPAPLAAARRPGAPYRVGVVCLGNICRSPIAEVVLTDRIPAAGLGDLVEVVSAGTGGWHVGDPMDDRAAAVLRSHGYDGSRHRATQVDDDWLGCCDLVLAMDVDNHDALSARVTHRLRMFRDFDPTAPAGDRDVPDPYYRGAEGFEEVLALVERTADSLVAQLVARSSEAGG